MNKRKIDVNELKKNAIRGKKCRNINVKYEVVLSYFKQKEVKQMGIFKISFEPLIQDLLKQLLNAEMLYKMQTGSKEPLRLIENPNQHLTLESFYLKNISKSYPIQQICECLQLEKSDTKNDCKVLAISKSKLMIFFKQLRLIYADFCYCAGEKYILEEVELKAFYEIYKSEWSKKEQKGRLDPIDKLQKKVCRSLFFLGVLIENNIYEAIDKAEIRKREENADLGTKSEKKKNIKDMNQNQSSTYSFGSTDLISNFSLQLRSQKSHEDDYYQKSIFEYPKNPYNEYSQKSERIVSKSKYDVFSKAEVKDLSLKIERKPKSKEELKDSSKFEINYLSNDVENILIEQAFKIQKFKDSCVQNQAYGGNYSTQMSYQGSGGFNYDYKDYMAQGMGQSVGPNPGYGQYPQQMMMTGNNYGMMNPYQNWNSNNQYQQNYYPGMANMMGPVYGLSLENSSVNSEHSNTISDDQGSNKNSDVNQIKRSLDFYNLVETRKNPYRVGKKKS